MGRVFDRGVLVGIALLAGLVVANAAVSYQNTRQVYRYADRVTRAHQVLALTGDVQADLTGLAAAQRYYLLTGDGLEEFRRAAAAARDRVARLRELTAGNPDQQARMDELDAAVTRAIARLEETARIRQEQGPEAAVRAVAAGASRGPLVEADRTVVEIEQAEGVRLAVRRQEAEEAYANALLFGAASAGFGLVAVGLFVWLLRRSTLARAAATAAVRHERERLQTTLASIGDAVVATDRHGRVTFLNGVAETLTGWPAAEAVGRPLAEVFRIVNETTRAEVENPALRALKEGVVVGLANHTVLIARDGTERPIDDSAAPIRDGAGGIGGAVLVFRDIAERRRAEESRARLAAIVESSDDAIVSKTLDGVIRSWNAGAERIFGWTAAEAVGKPITLIIPPDRLDEEREIIARLRRGERIDHFETVRVARDGRPVDVSVTVSPVRDAEGRVIGASKVGRDITDRKRAEAALRASEGRHRVLAELAAATHPLTDPAAIMAAAARLLAEHLGADRCAYAEVEDEAVYVITGEHAAGVPSVVGRWPVAAFGAEHLRLMRAGEPYVVHDTDADPRVGPADLPAFRATTIRAVVCVPLLKDGRLTAAMAVHQAAPRRWTPAEIELVTAVVGRCWEALERARVDRALRESETRFRSLFEAMDEGYCVVEPVYAAGRPADYRYLMANPALERQTGLRGVVGKTARELMPAHEQHWIEAYARVAVTGESFRQAGRVADLGRWYEVSAFRVGDGRVGVLFADVTARVRAEEAVRASEQRLAEVFRAAPAFMAVLRGPDHVFELANDRYVALVGGREVVGRPVREVLPEVVGQGFVELLDRVYRTGEPYVGTATRVVLAHGGGAPEERFLDFVYQPLRDADGAVAGIIVQGVDLTDRVRAEAAVRERDERLQVFLGAATDYAVVISDPAGRVVEWLGGAEAITGYSAAEAVGQPPGLIYTPEDRAAGVPEQELAAAARDGRAEDKRWHQRKDGGQFFADGVMVPLRGADGTVRGFGKVFRDATARKRAEDAVGFLADASASLAELVDYESTLRRIANIAVGGFADWCAVDLLDGGRRRRLAVTRAEPDEVAAARAADTPGDGVIPHVLRTGEPEVVPDLAALDPAAAPQGATRVARLREWGVRSYLCVPLVSRGRVIGGITFLSHSARRPFGPDELRVGQDLAGRVAAAIENAQLYRDLQEQDRRKDEFLATLAHELRNPLAPVRNGIQILRATLPPDDRADRALTMMDRQLGHMVHLVDDLLDVARVSSGKVVLRKERVELRAVVEAAVETTRAAVEAGGHELVLDLPAEPLALDADRTRVVQVLANLLSNAAKYTPHGGRIAVSARPADGCAVVRVADTGVGIPAEMLPKVFDMFTQVGTSLERSQGGLGIGLTLVKRLVEMHGGTVAAESEGPGRGSTFTVRLPLAAGETHPGEGAPCGGGGTPARLSVLVVDDNVDAAESLAMLLELQGHEVRVAHDGPEALRALGAYRPHLILLDIGLPGMTGYEVARRIRESQALRGVTLAALTGWGQEEDRRRSREAGFDHHLTKPADPAEVERILGEVARAVGG